MLSFHILLSLVGELMLAMALGVGLLYLLQENQLKKKNIGFFLRLPSLEKLDSTQVRLLMIGFISLTLGMILGMLSANMSFMQVWMFLGWLVYAFIVWARVKTGFRGRRAAWTSLMGFALVLFSGWHGYGWLL